MDFYNQLISLNNNLSSRGIKLRIEQRGGLLNIRGPLPCKEISNIKRTQRISTSLPANNKGLEEAEDLLKMIIFQLKNNQFDWTNWTRRSKHQKIPVDSIVEKINSFKSDFFSDPTRNNSSRSIFTTWKGAYLPYLRRLEQIANNENIKVNSDLLCKTLSSYKKNTRSRQQCGTVLNSFASYLEIKLPEDWRKRSCGYGIHEAHYRELPSDIDIKNFYELIPNPQWKLVYGLMATYGLRNHEVFFLDCSSFSKNKDKILRILPRTKTGEHQVWPFHPEWFDYFELKNLIHLDNPLPSINTNLNETSLQQIGKRVTEQFNRYGLNLTPYDLRHAWAVRTILIGLPDTVSARMMGHSVAIHTKTYHHWITQRDQQQAVDKALGRDL